MYAYLKGTIMEIEEDNIVLEVNGIGYNVRIPFSVAASLPGVGNDVKIYTYTCVREDAFFLYGFLTKDDLQTFKSLITVSGIGPKGALGVLSIMDADALRFAIMAGDAKAIAKAPGIGAKSAERIIIDLKDKVSIFTEDAMLKGAAAVTSKKASKKKGDSEEEAFVQADIEARNDAIEALVALGYSASDALRAIKSLGDLKGMDSEAILKAALKVII